jgi:hypothetical protein
VLLHFANYHAHAQLMYTAEMKRSTSELLSSKQAAGDALIDKLALGACR